ncbi:MAG: efflux RND transporter permease subunit, partial [Desulfobacula sp.]|nr:efflux RND transporter permease subunit [Desulfobacula sp.]
MKNIIEKLASNSVFANIVLIIIFITGGLAVTMMVREEMPNMALEYVVVSIAYPGADPEEVEEGVTRKIENAIVGIEGINNYSSTSKENICSVVIKVKKGYNADKVLDNVKNEVDSISNFPEDAESPLVSRPLVKHSVMTVYLTADMSERRMKEWGEEIKDEILRLPEISQVDISTTRDYEISVEVSEDNLKKYGLTISDVSNAIRASSINRSGGTIKTDKEEIRVRTLGRKYTGKDFASIVVLAKHEGEIITLDKIADIKDSFTEDKLKTLINSKPAVLVDVYKTDLEDSIDIANGVKKYLEEKKQTLPEGSEIGILADNSLKTQKTINILMKNGFIGLLLVFAILWFFLDTRLSFWAGMGIPVSLMGGLAILWFTGNTLNMITLFGLIMVLGIVADDAIIVGEAIYVHRQNGVPPLKAAVEGVMEVGLPVIAAVLTTIVAFIPLAKIDGVMGKFISSLPIAVIACLSISLIECLVLLPAHLSNLPDSNVKKESKNFILKNINRFHTFTSEGMEKFSKKIYLPFLRSALNYRYILFSIAISFLLITAGMFAGGMIKYDVFPEKDGYIVTGEIEYPEGTPFKITKKAIERLEEAALRLGKKIKTKTGEPLIVNMYSIYGQSPGKGLGRAGSKSSNSGGVQLILLNSNDRGVHVSKIANQWQKEVGTISGVKNLTFAGDSKGPPGAGIEVCIDGKDIDKISAASEEVKKRLEKFKGMTQVYTDNNPGKNVFTFKLKPEARNLGLTVNDLASQVYAGYYGMEAVKVQKGNDDIKVIVKYTEEERKSYSSLKQFRVRTGKGFEIPLSTVAKIEYGAGYSQISRNNGLRRIKFSAEVNKSEILPKNVVDELSKGFIKKMESKYQGITISFEGDDKKSKESFGSLYIWFPLAVLGIFMIVATMFKSYLQPVIILTTVPFGLIGAIWGHYFMGQMLSMLSVFGMVALTGVVVNDAIVLIDRVNQNLKKGMDFIESVTLGGIRRFRAVMLTSISTVGGLLPLILEPSPEARMLIPMSISLAAGVAFATVLTLILIPCLMVILNDLRRFFSFLI